MLISDVWVLISDVWVLISDVTMPINDVIDVWIGIISYSLNPVVYTTVFDKSHLKSLPSTGEWLSG